MSGFGNEFASEAVPGALPKEQNAPQKPPFGLYIEELNGTAFTAPRGVSRSDWTYRIRPSATHKPFRRSLLVIQMLLELVTIMSDVRESRLEPGLLPSFEAAIHEQQPKQKCADGLCDLEASPFRFRSNGHDKTLARLGMTRRAISEVEAEGRDDASAQRLRHRRAGGAARPKSG